MSDVGKDKSGIVSATELSQIAVCERKIYLKAKYGTRKDSNASMADKARGKALHKRAEHQNHEHRKVDKRCFIASCVYGIDAEETVFLRKFRDDSLSSSLLGRMFIQSYYKISPGIAVLLANNKWLSGIAKLSLDRLIKCLKK